MIDDKHPPSSIQSANFFSYMTFSWIQPKILYGKQNTIVADDIERLSENDRVQRISDLVYKEWTIEVENAKRANTPTHKERPNLFKVLWRCYGLYAMVPLISGFFEGVCKISEAVLLGYVIRFFNNPSMTIKQGMGYAVALFLVTLIHGTFHHHNFFHVLRLGTWIRQSLIALMYRKCLTLSTSSSISTGTVVNLISNDLQPFESFAPFGLYLILGPLEMIAGMYFLWQELGVACLAGLLALSLLMPLQAFFSRQFGSIRTNTVNARDERIRTLSDVFSGIELVKLCAWEVPFQEKIMMLRSIELKYIWHSNILSSINMAIYFFFQPVVVMFAFTAYWLQHRNAVDPVSLTPDKVFVSLTLFNILRTNMTSYFPKAIQALAGVRVSVKRITDFLLLPELRGIELDVDSQEADDSLGQGGVKAQDLPDILIDMRGASFSWAISTDGKNEILELSAKDRKEKAAKEKDAKNKKGLATHSDDSSDNDVTLLDTPKKALLNNITMTLRRDELLAIVGPVGSGKSSFCMAILEEMPLVSGSMNIAHHQDTRRRPLSMSYSAQSPWIFAGSIRSNILFGASFNQEHYDKVIKACELTRDLKLFPKGDATLIGEKGVTLSGGQRARVSLARAAYRDSDVYILDDPLSAVDPKVGRALFQNCINGLLKGKARVLVTHQLQYIKDCENVIVLERGLITHMGHVDEVMREEVEVTQVVQEGDDVRSINTRAKFVDVLREFARKVPEAPTEESILATADYETATLTTQNNSGTDDRKDKAATVDDNGDDGASIMEKNLTVEEVAEGETSFKAYIEFFRIGSTWSKLILTIICLAAAQTIVVLGEFFLTRWSGASAQEQKKSYYPTAFGLYCLGTVIMTLIRSYLFFDCLTASSRNIFRAMLDALMHTSIDFFHANPHGRVLNRFSKDMALIDELLPYVFFDATQIGFMLLGSVVTVCIVNPWIVIAVPIILSGFIALRSLYMKSSRQVKRIDSTSRSPIYSHLSETLDGLTSVRAFGVANKFMDEHIKTQEDNGRAFFTYLGMARWLGYRLDAVSAMFLGVTAIACVAVRDSQEASRAGLAMSSVISLSGELQWAIRMSVEAAILMVSVERMMEYAQTKPEISPRHMNNPDGTSVVSNGWPSTAQVSFSDMSLTYPRGDGPVLKNVSLNFRAGEKIGIVGRTGAGKSSMIGALFRLVETMTGNPLHRGGIYIDGIDISKIGVHDLRERMAIIPQEPFLFRGTLRFNLDPTNKHQDADIWAALEAAEMKRLVEGLEGRLDAAVDDNGKNFSIGERQLISLARAILRRSKIIVMDEATANVDLQSDRMIQKAIHTQFQGATVFTIAHRLNTVIGDYDRILVLDQGEVKEFGEPWELLDETSSLNQGWLKGMVAGTGPENEGELTRIAKELYDSRHCAAVA
ncbi:hypothetical protein KI688_000967 [Linnemannia hyalina]|uniref:P-loop containing nucleoside triphosphate hydrolase protein n=1 Tax=Linnemannia hyalina TaxID=64524 RepID=A0A9P8BYI5_9FUNG|nr:hypothetical protein KI688_000967 [Linnemannia hyalina]